MPVQFHFLQHVVNVNWEEGGGAFTLGDFYGFMAYSETGSDTPTWNALGDFGNVSCWGSSYHNLSEGTEQEPRPVFVMVGQSSQFGTILASDDGVNWSEAFTLGQDAGGAVTSANIMAVVWDAGAFWAGGHIVATEGLNVTESDILLTSIDGSTWSEAGRNSVSYLSTNPNPPSLPVQGLLVSHCHSEFLDANGNGAPDGIVAIDATANRRMAPAHLPEVGYQFGEGVAPNTESGQVQIRDEQGSRTVDTGLTTVQAVSFAGGIWWAVGGPVAARTPSEAAYSRDNGETWTRADPPAQSGTKPNAPSYATTICGAPQGDLA